MSIRWCNTQEMIEHVSEQFTTISFLRWHTSEGMDELEFTEAGPSMNDVSQDQNHQVLIIEHGLAPRVES